MGTNSRGWTSAVFTRKGADLTQRLTRHYSFIFLLSSHFKSLLFFLDGWLLKNYEYSFTIRGFFIVIFLKYFFFVCLWIFKCNWKHAAAVSCSFTLIHFCVCDFFLILFHQRVSFYHLSQGSKQDESFCNVGCLTLFRIWFESQHTRCHKGVFDRRERGEKQNKKKIRWFWVKALDILSSLNSLLGAWANVKVTSGCGLAA